MNILLISPLPPPAGGIATWTEKYIGYCKANRHKVHLVNTSLRGSRAIKINHKMNILSEIIRAFVIITTLRKSLRNTQIDIIHINTSCSKLGLLRDFLCVKMAKSAGFPVVVHCHCNVQDQLNGSLRLERLFQNVVNNSDLVIVMNQLSHNYVEKFSQKSVRIVPNFIEEDMIITNRQVCDEISEVIFVGHVQPSKGVFEIYDASKYLPHLHFTLVGPVKDEIRKRRKPENVDLSDELSRDKVIKMLDNADLFLFPSHTEGFSLALLEAMARGLPVIATDVGANREMISDFGGVLVPMHDVEAIVSALKSMKSKLVRESMSKFNVIKVRSEYTVDVCMRKLMETYAEVTL